MHMKKIFILLVILLINGLLFAQADDTLTNRSVIKMTRAKLADELIIDVIRSSVVKFDLSEDGISTLKNETVTEPVIEAMKKAAGTPQAPVSEKPPVPVQEKTQNIPASAVVPAAVLVPAPAGVFPEPVVSDQKSISTEVVAKPSAPVEVQNKPKPLTPKQKGKTETIVPPVKIEALKYSIPLKDIVSFHEKEFQDLTNYIIQWDKEIIDTTAAIKQINTDIQLVEIDLTLKKNAATTKYSSQILTLIAKQTFYRSRYKQAINNLMAVGEEITGRLDDIGNEKARSLSNTYGETRQQVKSANANPAIVSTSAPITFPNLRIITNTTKYLVPVTEILNWHQNKIYETREVVKQYNAKVEDLTAKDAELLKQLEPVNRKLDEYGPKSKAFKTEIAALKKQKSGIEKQRKALADQMENDSSQLAEYLKQQISDCQDSLKERFEDIIMNVDYLFKEQLSY